MVSGSINFRGMLPCGPAWLGAFLRKFGKRLTKEQGAPERGLGHLVSRLA